MEQSLQGLTDQTGIVVHGAWVCLTVSEMINETEDNEKQLPTTKSEGKCA